MVVFKKITPNYLEQKKEYTFFQKIKYVLFCFVSAYMIIIGFRLLFEIIDIILENHGFALIGDFQIGNIKLQEKSNLNLVYELLIFAPIVEESVFRLPLNLKSNNFLIAFILTLSLTIFYFLKPDFNLEFYFLSFYGFYLLTVSNFKDKNRNLFQLNFLISTFLFGIFHLLNYKSLNFNNLGYYFLNIIPMIIFGYYFAKIRLKFNIFWSILLHAMSNLIPCLLLIFSK